MLNILRNQAHAGTNIYLLLILFQKNNIINKSVYLHVTCELSLLSLWLRIGSVSAPKCVCKIITVGKKILMALFLFSIRTKNIKSL